MALGSALVGMEGQLCKILSLPIYIYMLMLSHFSRVRLFVTP